MFANSSVSCLCQLRYVGRPVSAIPATGIGEVHQQESNDIIDALFTKAT